METNTESSSRARRWLLGLLLPALLVAAFGLVATACGDDDDDSDNGDDAAMDDNHEPSGELTATDAWARFPKEDTGAVYVHLSGGAEADALIGVKVDFDAVAEIHETVTTGSTSSMQHVERLEVPADGHVEMAPGGYHIMLMMVKELPEVGATFNIELEFEHAGTMTVPVEVRAFE